MLFGKLGTDRGELLLGRHFGEDLARLQFKDGALDHFAQHGRLVGGFCEQRHQRLAILRHAARLRKIFKKRRDFAVGGQAHLADRMHEQRPARTDRQEMNEAGAAENHFCYNSGMDADVNPVHPTLASPCKGLKYNDTGRSPAGSAGRAREARH